MAGQLNEHPLAELIREISAAALSGVLRLSRERAKIAVYFDAGELIYGGANLRTYRLYECVRRWRVLDGAQLGRADETTSDLEFGRSLVAKGLLSAESLTELVVQQVSEILCHALLWTEGSWEFDPRVRVSSEMRVKVNVPTLLAEAARRLPPELAASRFRSSNEMILPGEDAPADFQLLPTEAFILTRVDAPMRLHELVSISGLSEYETKRVAYVLALGGFLKRDGWPVALTEEEVSKARAILATHSAPVEAKVEVQPEKKKAPSAADELDDLDAMFKRLRLSTNYYQMLGLVRPTTDAEVKRAYHSLAKRFHPDRFRNTVDDELHTRIESAFVQIAQAYETLKDKQLRAVYDSNLLSRGEAKPSRAGSQPQTPEHAEPRATARETGSRGTVPPASNSAHPSRTAEEQFKDGLAALESGNQALAITCLGEAARLSPSEPKYRAYYGRALGGQESLQRSAEAELKAAVALDANNPTYRVMLAELYVAVGLLRRAQGELQRALSIDPRNAAARKLLNTLN